MIAVSLDYESAADDAWREDNLVKVLAPMLMSLGFF